ncbi:brevianamide F reverse prenyltransferase [Aspergillus homomorphus CBS 101889]|uniref:Brevianamide F reverse prenyltransferase n=1 Tax=Aspergillus homomorphus (strain CBS 101889) TaxID=1450537 RepID=A0A395HL54_ASPHC|nr:brevianamide F reverse prenyltransferase [Aspergillus homomorphus CBS 101889]RAL08587.1 brevianamide F reverse prenyltransferase [Aspergillus homomorphus CBS 101889]
MAALQNLFPVDHAHVPLASKKDVNPTEKLHHDIDVKEENDQVEWWQDTGRLCGRFLQVAGYSPQLQDYYLGFTNTTLIPALGPHPQEWRSVITRSGLAIEYSLNFQENTNPMLRIGFEPISYLAKTDKDPFNKVAHAELCNQLAQMGLKGFDSTLFHHFAKDFLLSDHQADNFPADRIGPDTVRSQAAFGFDFKDGKIGVKGYVFPRLKALSSGIPVGQLIMDSVRKVEHQMQCSGPAVSLLNAYMEENGGYNEYTFLSWDFVTPAQSRLKFYGVHNDVTMRKVAEMWTLDGRLLDETTLKGLVLIERLWRLLKIGEGVREYEGTWDDGVKSTDKDVATPIVWNYEIRQGCDQPIPKLYFPVHGENDLLVAQAISEFFRSIGWIDRAEKYVDELRFLYPEEDIATTSRLQSWISFAYTKQTGVYMSVYYHSTISYPWSH